MCIMVVVTIGNQQRHKCVVGIVNGENVMTQTYLGLNIVTVIDSCVVSSYYVTLKEHFQQWKEKLV